MHSTLQVYMPLVIIMIGAALFAYKIVLTGGNTFSLHHEFLLMKDIHVLYISYWEYYGSRSEGSEQVGFFPWHAGVKITLRQYY